MKGECFDFDNLLPFYSTKITNLFAQILPTVLCQEFFSNSKGSLLDPYSGANPMTF
jgi:hypothetical protein